MCAGSAAGYARRRHRHRPDARRGHGLRPRPFAVRGRRCPAAHLPFDGRTASPAEVAYAFATRIDNLDGHDGYQPAKGHAGVALVPALLAVEESHETSIDGRNTLTALIIGYEIACRAAIALHESASDYHSSGAWNALGAAALADLIALTGASTHAGTG